MAMLPAFLLTLAGMGLAVPAMTTAVLASVDKRWAATAAAGLNAERQAAGAVGVALFEGLADGGIEWIVPGLAESSSLSAILVLAANRAAALV